MSVEAHQQVERLVAQAEHLRLQGRTEEAVSLFREAAQLEAFAFDRIPQTRPRTRGIIAVSAVSLYMRAEEFEEARRLAHLYLAERELHAFAKEQLENLLLDARREQHARSTGHTLGSQGFVVSLKGPVMVHGLAPLETVVLKLQQLEKYLLRIGEWVASKPFRRRGSVDPEVRQLCLPMVTEPSVGSFQFELRLQSPLQLSLFDANDRLTPDNVATAAFDILDLTTNGAIEELEQQVPDEMYREAFLKLVRNLVPDGKEFEELEVRRVGGSDRSVAILTLAARETIQRHLSMPRAPAERETVRTGILRALHLDEGWLILIEDGQPLRCRIRQDHVFDDVVGPFVNRRVRATGYRKAGRFYVEDIVLDTDGAPAAAIESSS